VDSTEPIRSPQNARLKLVRGLRRGRERHSVLLEGARVIDEALDAGLALDFVLHKPETDSKSARVLARAREAGLECFAIEAKLLSEGSDLDAPSDVVAVAARPDLAAAELIEASVRADGLLLVAAGVQDPGNVGALIRVAAGLGAYGALFLQGGASPWHPRALRGASGTSFRLPVAEGLRLEEFIELTAAHSLPIWITAADGDSYRELDRSSTACALVLGEEGGGVPASLRAAAAQSVGIPLQRGLESLNVATAAAILVAALSGEADV
jgi:RNA methyltransferase, TrmH family